MDTQSLFKIGPDVKKNRLPQLPNNPELDDPEKAVGLGRFPSWLHRRLPEGGTLFKTGALLEKNRLHTVCEEARCPNLLECWSRKTATFLTLGSQCTRNCGFCSIDFTEKPKAPDSEEPQRIAASVKALQLRHVVLTMVARDDLEDGGASHLCNIVEEVRKENPGSTIELLTSDFHGSLESWEKVVSCKPEIFNHNIETVRRLSPRVRHKATYERTLQFLHFLSKRDCTLKSGLMVGLGETEEEVYETLRDLQAAGCSIVTIGQYLQPAKQKLLVKSFVHPDTFGKYAAYGKEIGIKNVYAGPFVRSSYHADQFVPV